MENPVFVYIEDDPASRMVVQVIMKRVLKYEHLTIFPDSRDIMARINALDPQPNVMFIDIQMKPHDGYQVLQLLRADERYADALIVAMTAFKQPFALLCRAAVPFIAVMLVCLVVVIWQPWIAMYFVTGKF